MKRYKICVIGDVGGDELVFNGQTAKTRDYIYYLKKRYGEDKVQYVDTRNWKKKIVGKTISLLKAMSDTEVLVLSLGSNGRKLTLPLTLALKKVFKNRILFSVVGGTLMYGFDQEVATVRNMQKTDANFVETRKFESFLKERGIKNVYYSPVFSKRKSITDEAVLEKAVSAPYRFCTYSRVCREKGTTEAIDAIAEVNRLRGKVVCELDIYGHPSEDYAEEFNEKVKNAGDCIHVHPYLDDTNAIDTLSEHYMMLFPTFYDGEGFPIAIVECLKSGVPVIASDWHFNSEVVVDNITGRVFSLEDKNALTQNIMWAIDNPDKVLEMKHSCLERAKLFEPDQALKQVYRMVDGK